MSADNTPNINQAAKKKGFLAAPPPIARRSAEEVSRAYPRWRLSVFMGIFIGYAGFYLLRNNLPLVVKLMTDDHAIGKVGVGIIANAVFISYGLSKFFSATISDRSNARYFLPLGLALSATANLVVAFVPVVSTSIAIFAIVMFINGWFQGMGWPPCGRILVHWFSTRERGTKTAIWNLAHNVGAVVLSSVVTWGLFLTANDWRVGFWLPALFGYAVAAIAFFTVRDTPESIGLPPIEEYNDDPAKVDSIDDEVKNMSYAQIVIKHVLLNRTMFFLALANVFVYAVRYGIVTWAPIFLHDIHGASTKGGIAGFAAVEGAAIIGTLLCGWVSDKVFKGYRTGAGILFMFLVAASIAGFIFLPAHSPSWICLVLLGIIGAGIYGPVMLIGLQALDLSPRNVAGTSAGFTGLFGYLLGASIASTGIGYLASAFGWTVTFIVLIACCVVSIILLQLVGKDERALIAAHQVKSGQ